MRGPQVEGLTEENLRKLYVEDDAATLASVGEQLGCHAQTVRRWLKRYGLPIKPKTREGPRSPEARLLADKEWLAEQLQTKTQKEIAKELGIDNQNISYWARKHGLMDREKSKAVRKALKKRYPDGRFGEDASNWRGGKRELSSGYIYVYAPDHPHATQGGTVMEHRLIMEEQLGRYLEPDEVVHHLDGDKTNNDPDNLMVMKRGEHVSDHFTALARLRAAEERIAELEAEIERLKSGKEN